MIGPEQGFEKGDLSIIPIPILPHDQSSIIPIPILPHDQSSIIPIPILPHGQSSIISIPILRLSMYYFLRGEFRKCVAERYQRGPGAKKNCES